MTPIPVCPSDELPEGECRVVTVGDRDVAVFRSDGAVFAIDDLCPHAGASLSTGYVEKGCVTCPWHGWRFRLSDGAWADNPRVKTGHYRAVDENGTVVVLPDRIA